MAKKKKKTSTNVVSNQQPDIEGILRNISNENTAKTFAFNSQEAQKSRDFSKMMSDTSHQREVEDLKKAGLNPVLSANGGAQAYSASSASGQADNSAVGVLASLYQTKMNNQNAVKLAKLQNSNNLQIAKINAAAQAYSANTSSSASKYAIDMQPESQVFNMIDAWTKGSSSNAKKTAKGGYVIGKGLVGTLAKIGTAIGSAYLHRKR